MAKARPQAPVRDRAIAAYKRACPSSVHGIQTFKVRGRQIIRVRGYDAPDSGYGQTAEWSYADNGSLRRVS